MTDDRSIVRYSLTEEDRKIKNPFLEEVMGIVGGEPSPEESARRLKEERADLVMKYAFTIPYHELIVEIASRGPIVEIGAGSGYWAWMLSQAGADVMAVDKYSPDEVSPWDFMSANRWYDDTWYYVDEGEARSAGAYPERNLFLAWPMFSHPMALDALNSYEAAGGKTVIFLGDASMAGDENFHQKLNSFPSVTRIPCMGWPGLREELVIAQLT